MQERKCLNIDSALNKPISVSVHSWTLIIAPCPLCHIAHDVCLLLLFTCFCPKDINALSSRSINTWLGKLTAVGRNRSQLIKQQAGNYVIILTGLEKDHFRHWMDKVRSSLSLQAVTVGSAWGHGAHMHVSVCRLLARVWLDCSCGSTGVRCMTHSRWKLKRTLQLNDSSRIMKDIVICSRIWSNESRLCLY